LLRTMLMLQRGKYSYYHRSAKKRKLPSKPQRWVASAFEHRCDPPVGLFLEGWNAL